MTGKRSVVRLHTVRRSPAPRSWRLDDKGSPRKDIQNVAVFLRDVLTERLVYDEFTDELLLDGRQENAVERITQELYATSPEVSWTTDLVRAGVEYAIGTGQITTTDSLRTALDAIPPAESGDDPVSEAVASAIIPEVGYPQKLAVAVLRSWLIGAVARILEPGYKVDSILVLVGPQGIGKSTFARAMALDERWFTDAVPLSRLDDRDSIMQLQGHHVVEFAELAGLQRAELEAVKGWITRQVDVYRAPYARRASRRPRRFVCIATTNREEFLDDVQNRRFWLLRVRSIDTTWFRRNRNRLYAHARSLFEAGMHPVLTRAAAAELAREHDRAIEEDPWEQPIVEYAARKKILTFEGIFRHLGHAQWAGQKKDMRRVNDIIRRRLPMFEKVQMRQSGHRRWVFRRRKKVTPDA